jgi:hypothetical protein
MVSAHLVLQDVPAATVLLTADHALPQPLTTMMVHATAQLDFTSLLFQP